MKLFYGFLNYRSDFDNTRAILESVKPEKEDHLVLVKSKSTLNFNDNKNYSVELADQSVPKCYNKLIEAAKAAGSDYCFLISDDLEIADTSVFEKYAELADKYNQTVVMFPYNRPLNVALSKFPNPISRIKTTDDETLDITRFPDSDFMCIKISDNMVKFDERLDALYLDFFINDNVKAGGVHNFGFFIDIHDSFKYIKRTKDKRIKTVFTDVQVQTDGNIRSGEKLELSADLNHLVKHIYKVNKELKDV